MNLKVEVTVRGDLTRPWHCQQGRIDKGRQGTGFVLLFRCEKVTQTHNPTAIQWSAAWWDSCLRSVNNAETKHWIQPPGESQHYHLCQTQSDERKEQNYSFVRKQGEKNEVESRLIGLFGKLNSQRRAANKHGKQWENNEKWVKWNAKYWLRCWFSKGQWNNVTQLVV